MSKNIPSDLRYTKEHEWVRSEGDAVVVGITDHAQSQLGDVVFLELPEVGSTMSAGDAFGVVESVKAVSDLFAPLDGEVLEVNAELVDTPEKVNEDPYGVAWMVKLKPTAPEQLDGLLDASSYESLIDEEG